MKLAQPDLFGNEPDEHGLTERQRAAWDLVRTTPGGVTADEVGASWHAHRGKHAEDQRCKFCAEEGASVLRSKALYPLVVRRRSGQWQPRNAADVHTAPEPRPEPTDAELAANPFAGL